VGRVLNVIRFAVTSTKRSWSTPTQLGMSSKQLEDVFVGKLDKNASSEIRAQLRSWQGHRLADLRLYIHRKKEDEWIPSHKGVAVRTSQLPELRHWFKHRLRRTNASSRRHEHPQRPFDEPIRAETPVCPLGWRLRRTASEATLGHLASGQRCDS
jgi:hypothetical protein